MSKVCVQEHDIVFIVCLVGVYERTDLKNLGLEI